MAKNTQTILVKSKSPKGFRRAGFAFTREGVELEPGKLKKRHLDAIVNEPNLVVIGEVESDADRGKREAAEKAAADKAAADKAAADKAAADKAGAGNADAGKSSASKSATGKGAK